MAARRTSSTVTETTGEIPEAPVESIAPDNSVDNKSIYELISIISREAGALAPEKKGGVPFAFRGIDGTVAHLAPFLQKYGVITIPSVRDRITTQREVGSKILSRSDLLVDFTFVGPRGDSITATTAGLADDYSDRSAAQAQSVAFRVALLQTFALPTHSKEPEESGEDARATTERELSRSAAPKPATPSANTEIVEIKARIMSKLPGIAEALDASLAELASSSDRAKVGVAVKLYGEGITGKPISEWTNNKQGLLRIEKAIDNGEAPE